MVGSVVFGIVLGTVTAPRVAYLEESQPVTDQLLALAAPVKPTEVFRLAAPCAGGACQHFDGSRCRLVRQTVRALPVVADLLPPCPIRRECRWWQEEGKEACRRCPQVATESYHMPPELRRAAEPAKLD
jgi:hypothetical protein